MVVSRKVMPLALPLFTQRGALRRSWYPVVVCGVFLQAWPTDLDQDCGFDLATLGPLVQF